jgi:TPP-dependent trihydroxycyclohexane-1,2-dione (THcHDO) dehydratase
MAEIRLRVAQALVKFLSVQYSESDGEVETDPLVGASDSESWWDVPVSETSTFESTRQARKTYEEHKATQKLFL